MYRLRRLFSVGLGVAVLVSLLSGGYAVAQESQSAKVRLTPSRDSGVRGSAIFTDAQEGVEVDLRVRGLPEAGVEHINHIHAGGTCADDRAGRTAPVTIPLNNVVASEDGTGSATTTVADVTVAELFAADEERFVLLHAKTARGEGVPPGVACADLVPRSGNDGFDALPASGGTQPTVILAIPLALALGSVAVFLALHRRSG